MLKRIFQFILCFFLFTTSCFSLTLTTGTGGAKRSVEETLLKKMETPEIPIVRTKDSLVGCKMVADIGVVGVKEFWESVDTACDRLLVKLKKMTKISGGDTLYLRVGLKGCPIEVESTSYKCLKDKD